MAGSTQSFLRLSFSRDIAEGATGMKAHIVGGGFGGLAAAFFLIRNADVPGDDITIYEAGRQIGGGLFLTGDAQTGYNMPGSVFDREFRCTFELFRSIPSARIPPCPSRTPSSRSTTKTPLTIARTSSTATSTLCTARATA